MVGSVNAARGHFQTGADDLEQARSRWGAHLDGLITQRYAPAEFASSPDRHEPDSIKQVVEWTSLAQRA
jgi:Glucose dehydrogenase C-terminus